MSSIRKQILAFLADGPVDSDVRAKRNFADLRRACGHPDYDYMRPLENPVHAELSRMVSDGMVVPETYGFNQTKVRIK